MEEKNPETSEKKWTPEEIADDLRIDVATVRRWLRDGSLVGLKLGRQWRIPDTDYKAFLKAQRNDT